MARNTEPGMGKTKGGTNGSGKTTKYQKATAGGTARWGLVDSALVTDMLDAIQRQGDAAIFGCTRDGGVLVLTLCSGEDRTKYYARTVDEMDVHMREVLEIALDTPQAT